MTTSPPGLEAPQTGSIEPAPKPTPTRATTAQWTAVALITLAALALRLVHIGRVSPDPFYDAAVRSMGLSWHNFFLGAFEPGGSLSIDKPPADLWLQVASVKILGFSSTTLKLPEVFAGTAAVPLLFATVRRIWSAPAGLAAAAALAVLPVEVITSRSDTMDGVMMALTLFALWLIVRASESGRGAWLLAAAAVLGVAFNVKLLESAIALPGLALFAYLALPGSQRRRLVQLLAAGAVYVAISLSWLTATLLVPAHDRPWAIGSTNGSAWNAAFVFNGTDRLGSKSPEPQFTVYKPGHHYPEATQSERDHIPIVPPSPTRLLARIGPLSGERLGLILLVAVLLGVPGLITGLRAERASRLVRGVVGGLALWTATGVVLFSHMARLHPRYVEAFTPAVAALLGIGVTWACSGGGRARLVALTAALAATVYYVERLLYGVTGVWWITAVAALGALVLALRMYTSSTTPPGPIFPTGPAPGAAAPPSPGPPPPTPALLSAATIALTLLAVLALPLRADFTAIENGVTDAGYVGALPREEQRLVSAYVRAHQGSARYELAAESATQIGSLIVQDARPLLVLTSYGTRVFTPVAKLRRLIASGEVRYAFLNSSCHRHAAAQNAACTAPVRWVREHGTDVSGQAGLSREGVLWLLSGARA
jgi:4-amino-4-deoxy-L-arabinose transferase-like glycosyltransferase